MNDFEKEPQPGEREPSAPRERKEVDPHEARRRHAVETREREGFQFTEKMTAIDHLSGEEELGAADYGEAFSDLDVEITDTELDEFSALPPPSPTKKNEENCFWI